MEILKTLKFDIVHAYERTFAIYNNKIDPINGTVYITNGIGGTGEGLYDTWEDETSWSAFR